MQNKRKFAHQETGAMSQFRKGCETVDRGIEMLQLVASRKGFQRADLIVLDIL